ncbi:MAG: trigger factor [Patescibacteria group bacterium]|jgi:trigger factor
MNVQKQNLGKSQVELTVEISVEEFAPYVEKAVEKIAKDIKIDGFRPGHAPADMVKKKVGEITILEEAANLAINKTIGEVFREHLKDEQPIGQPDVRITKLAPNNPMEYKVAVVLLPSVELGEYKNFGLKKDEVKVSDEDVNKVVDQLREMKVKETPVEREIKEGDKVIADIEMFLDKVPIEGGQGKNAFVIIGKSNIVPGLDKKLIGGKKGDTREFSLPYPDNFHQKNIAGKMVEFRVKINDVFEREIPELDDDLVKTFGAKNPEELKKNIADSLKQEKNQQTEVKLDADIMERIVKGSKYGDIPETLVNEEAHALMHEIEHQIQGQGGKFEDYLASLKKSKAEFMLDLAPEAMRRVKMGLALREIIKKEKIDVPMAEVDKRQEELIKQYKGYEKVEERVKSDDYKRQLYSAMLNQKAVENLREWNLANKEKASEENIASRK